MRPIFLRGLRRLVVRLDAHIVELAGLLFVIAAFLVLALLSFARADAGCAAPGDHQVLVWSQTAGQHRCQYLDREP
jgi:hypothetical protein